MSDAAPAPMNELTPEGRLWALAHAESITAHIALKPEAHAKAGWPQDHIAAATKACNEAAV